MYTVSWQVIPFPYNANKKRIFVTITNRSSQIKFLVVVRSCTRTIGKLKDIPAIAQLVPVVLLVILANGLVLVSFVKRTQLRTPANYVLFSLAACDFITGVINIPLFIIVAFTLVIHYASKFRSDMVDLVSVLNNFTAMSACYHILAATSEKYLSIIWPVKHRLITRKKFLKCFKLFGWCLSL